MSVVAHMTLGIFSYEILYFAQFADFDQNPDRSRFGPFPNRSLMKYYYTKLDKIILYCQKLQQRHH